MLFGKYVRSPRSGGKRCTRAMYDALHVNKLMRSKGMSWSERFDDIAVLSTSLVRSNMSGNALDIITTLSSLSRELSDRGVDIVVGGSIAAMISVPPRYTKDIDINIRNVVHGEQFSEVELKSILSDIQGVDLSTFAYKDGMTPSARTLVTPKIVLASFAYHGWPVDAFLNTEGKVNAELFDRPVVRHGLKFAPPECICFWKMMSHKHEARYHKDRSDVVSLLISCAHINKSWVRDQLVLLDGETGDLVREWEELVLVHGSSQ